MADPLPTTIGRYHIRAFIARGGMGTVYLAWDPSLDRQLAIKLLREADNEELRIRFTREAKSAASLRHRNIVTVFDVGHEGTRPFIAMEYVNGQTLADLIKGHTQLSTTRKLRLVEDLCDGLAYAHGRGIVHRDVKPANLMLDADGVLKILDFGIARAVTDSGMTQTGLLVGSLNYMSPEQVAGNPVDGRSDEFAVGAVLFELCANRPAFPGSLESGLLHRILVQPVDEVLALAPNLDASIAAIVTRALQKDPEHRFPDLRAMAGEIAAVRERLEIEGRTEPSDAGETRRPQELFPAVPTPPVVPPSDATPRTPKRGTSREDLARRRAAHIDEHLGAARRSFDAGDLDDAIAHCEQVLLLDPDDAPASELLERARNRRDELQADQLIGEAEIRLSQGDVTRASALVTEALALAPGYARSRELSNRVEEALRVRELERQRAAAVSAAVDRGESALRASEFEAALANCVQALEIEPSNAAALALQQRVREGIAREERRRIDQAAQQTADEARRLFDAGEHAEALALLEDFRPAHSIVSQLWTELASRAASGSDDDLIETLAVPPRDDSHAGDETVIARGPVSSTPAGAAIEDLEATAVRPPEVRTPSAFEALASSPSTGPEPRRRDQPVEVSRPVRRRGYGFAAAAVAAAVLAAVGYFGFRGRNPSTTEVASTRTESAAPEPAARSGVPPASGDSPSASPATPSSVPASSAPIEPTVPAPVAPPQRSVDALVKAARSSIAAGRYQEALGAVEEGLKSTPNQPELRGLARQVAAAAERDATAARRSVGNASLNEAPGREGVQAFNRARQLARTGQSAQAAQAYWRAADAFRSAAAAPTSPAPSDRPTSAARSDRPGRASEEGTAAAARAPSTSPSVEPPPASVVNAAPPPAAAPSTPAPTPVAPSVTSAATSVASPAPPVATPEPPTRRREPVDETASATAAIRSTLAAYAQGFRSLDVQAVARVFPSVNVASLTRAFQDAREQDVSIDIANVAIQGSRATVTGRLRQVFRPKVGREIDRLTNVEFEMQKVGNNWMIASRRDR